MGHTKSPSPTSLQNPLVLLRCPNDFPIQKFCLSAGGDFLTPSSLLPFHRFQPPLQKFCWSVGVPWELSFDFLE